MQHGMISEQGHCVSLAKFQDYCRSPYLPETESFTLCRATVKKHLLTGAWVFIWVVVAEAVSLALAFWMRFQVSLHQPLLIMFMGKRKSLRRRLIVDLSRLQNARFRPALKNPLRACALLQPGVRLATDDSHKLGLMLVH